MLVKRRWGSLAKSSITQRWMINNVGVIFIVLTAVVVGFGVIMQSYYYASAKQYISSRMNVISGMLGRYAQDVSVNFTRELRSMVETFEERDKGELMVVSKSGRVLATSSGFTPSETEAMPDFQQAKASDDGLANYVWRLSTGEKVMAVCSILPGQTDAAAIRLVVSLEDLDAQIKGYITVLAFVCIGILSLMVFSGLYFVKSIVMPVRQISSTARLFAKGDFSLRIPDAGDDEIGQLCEIVNHMADEISNSESMKNDFISSVSHELRTPLTAIKGWAETIAEMTDDPVTVKKGMGVISHEVQRLAQMVEELLDFSRMQSGHFTLQREKMDVLAELGDAVLMYTEKARKEGITLSYDEPAMLPFVSGDRNRLRQVFINIIDNALKYSDKGGQVTVQAGESEDGRVRVSVADCGCGISPEDLPRIKTKFYKANHTRRGSGIGLAVADEIVSMHGGELEVLSELGVGTTVVITLPLPPEEKP